MLTQYCRDSTIKWFPVLFLLPCFMFFQINLPKKVLSIHSPFFCPSTNLSLNLHEIMIGNFPWKRYWFCKFEIHGPHRKNLSGSKIVILGISIRAFTMIFLDIINLILVNYDPIGFLLSWLTPMFTPSKFTNTKNKYDK